MSEAVSQEHRANNEFVSVTQETNYDDDEYGNFEPSEKHKRSPNDSFEQKNQHSVDNETKKRRLEDDKSNDKSKRNSNGRQRNNSSSRNGGGGGRRNGNNNSRNDSRNDGRNEGRKDSGQEVYLKVLIPQGAAGGVIGHKGEKIGHIQKDSQCKIKMSKSNEYYPNTTERVCLIVGTAKSVVKAYELINARIQDRPDRSIDDERLKEIRILIPSKISKVHVKALLKAHTFIKIIQNVIHFARYFLPILGTLNYLQTLDHHSSTAGLLIGKGGSYIKTIKDSSGAFVQVSHKTNEMPERIVTIEGNEERRMKALDMVVEKIAEDPQHNMITTLVYNSSRDNHNNSNDDKDIERFSNQVANFIPALPIIQNNVASIAGLNNLSMLIVNSGGASQMTADSLMESLGSMGYMQHAVKEIIDAVSVLMRYGLIVKQEQSLGNSGNSQGNLNLNNSNYGDRDNYQRSSQSRNSSHGINSSNNNNFNSYNDNNNMSSQNNNLNPTMNNVLQMLRNSMGKQSQNTGY